MAQPDPISLQDVVSLHIAVFGRSPDRAGLSAWVDEVVSGEIQTRAALAMRMLVDGEARAEFGGLNIEQSIDRVFQNLLNRDAGEGVKTVVQDLAALSGGSQALVKVIDAIRNADPANPAAADPRSVQQIGDDRAMLGNKTAVAEYFALDGPGTVDDAAALFDAVTSTTDTTSSSAVQHFVNAVLRARVDTPMAVDDRVAVEPGERVETNILDNDILAARAGDFFDLASGDRRIAFTVPPDLDVSLRDPGVMAFDTDPGFTRAASRSLIRCKNRKVPTRPC